jgi:two-component system, chemotaxis family, chemotaxis protein CheY
MKKRILVVEDSATIRKFICEVLEARGYNTVAAGNIRDAWDMTRDPASNVNLVVADYHLAEGSGLELLRMIKANKITQSIPVIFLTSESDPARISEARSAGLHAWVIKPYRANVFFRSIEMALGTETTSR